MSYIDSFDHEFVGYFGGLPLYHPLVDYVAQPGDEFGCTTQQLIIGGGSGEHPALILRRPELAVAQFALRIFGEEENRTIKTRFDEEAANIVSRWSFDYFDQFLDILPSQALEYVWWTVEDYYDFHQLCSSPAFYTPFRREEWTFDHWLLISLGEFIVYAMPELVPELVSQMPGIRQVKHRLYTNILLPPPGYPILAGRRVIDGKIVWGQQWKPKHS